MKYNIKRLFAILFTATVLSACSNDWLDVKPTNETSAEDLFLTEQGFQEALTGVYTLMTKPTLYGKEMSYGFVDVIGQQWALSGANASTNPTYFYARQYDFENESTYRLIESIWAAQYNAIANVNSIIGSVDAQRSVFEQEQSYALMKGEALALRAYLHFDLLRLFAPNDFVTGESVAYIPYVDELSKDTPVSGTASEVAARCVEDLLDAIQLLEQDPIKTGAESLNAYYQNRHYHMNYYAAKGLLARIYLYMGQKTEALLHARDVIEAEDGTRFRWVSQNEATAANENNMDYTYSSEHLFALNIRKLGEYSQTSFGTESATALMARKNNRTTNTLFNEEPNDYRTRLYVSWNGFEKQFAKYKQVGLGMHTLPMITLPEMYYIAAECASPAEAVSYLETAREHRGLSNPVSSDKITEELYKEYQKEFVGEGQLFYFYKRQGLVPEGAGVNYTPVLPLPRVEIDLGNR